MRRHVITEAKPSHLISEQYYKVKTNIEALNLNHKMSVFQLTSTVAKEGKTTTIVNLANTFARTEHKVLLIDMDLRRPKLHRHFMIPNMRGLGVYLTQNISLEDVIIKEKPNLHILIAGNRFPFPDSLLSSCKINDMINQLQQEYDYIFIDSPPARDFVDATLISHLVDGTIFVVGHKKANKNHARSCVKHLQQTGVNIIGSIYSRSSGRLTNTYGYTREEPVKLRPLKKLSWSIRTLK